MHDPQHDDDECHAGDEPEQLRGGVLERHALLQLRSQVGHDDVDEAARGDDEKVRKQRLPRPDDEVADDADAALYSKALVRDRPALSSTMQSPTSCGISCAMIVSAITVPSRRSVRKRRR